MTGEFKMPAGKFIIKVQKTLMEFYETDYMVMFGLDDFDDDQLSFTKWLRMRLDDPISEVLEEDFCPCLRSIGSFN